MAIFLNKFINMLTVHIGKGGNDLGRIFSDLITSKEEFHFSHEFSKVFVGAIKDSRGAEFNAIGGGCRG